MGSSEDPSLINNVDELGFGILRVKPITVRKSSMAILSALSRGFSNLFSRENKVLSRTFAPEYTDDTSWKPWALKGG